MGVSWGKLKLELAKTNYNARVAAARLGITPGAIYARYDRMCVDFMKEKLAYRARVKHIRAKDLRKAMIETGFHFGKLAAKTGLKEKTLQKRLGRLGLKKEAEERIGWPIKLSKPSVALLKSKVEEANRTHGVGMTVSEAIRVAVIYFAGFNSQKVYRHCMRYRESLWRLRRRSKEKSDAPTGPQQGGVLVAPPGGGPESPDGTEA